jgi:hypothetical protein
MENAKEVDIADNNDDEYAIGNDGNNKPLAEGDDNDDEKYASTACCADTIILSAMPAESMILSALAESIMLSAPPAESTILSATPTESIACLHPESQCASVPPC